MHFGIALWDSGFASYDQLQTWKVCHWQVLQTKGELWRTKRRIYNPEQRSHSCQIQKEELTKVEKQKYTQMPNLISLMLPQIRILTLTLHSKAAFYKWGYRRNKQTGSPIDLILNQMQHWTVMLFQRPTVGLEKQDTVPVPDSVVLLVNTLPPVQKQEGGDGEGWDTQKRRSNPC